MAANSSGLTPAAYKASARSIISSSSWSRPWSRPSCSSSSTTSISSLKWTLLLLQEAVLTSAMAMLTSAKSMPPAGSASMAMPPSFIFSFSSISESAAPIDGRQVHFKWPLEAVMTEAGGITTSPWARPEDGTRDSGATPIGSPCWLTEGPRPVPFISKDMLVSVLHKSMREPP